jgi:hypothetical protein
MNYKTIAISAEHKKLVKQYATEQETTIKAVVEQLISELMAESKQQQFAE